MHYYDAKTIKNKQDPSWQNQGIYFWSDDEPFERKSLPDFFLTLQQKFFILEEMPKYLTIQSARAIPWFGKPGGGVKHFFSFNDEPITIEEAYELKSFTYVEFVTLHKDNLAILQDKKNYIFLADSNLKFKNTLPFYNDKPITLSEMYKSGKIKILKLT